MGQHTQSRPRYTVRSREPKKHTGYQGVWVTEGLLLGQFRSSGNKYLSAVSVIETYRLHRLLVMSFECMHLESLLCPVGTLWSHALCTKRPQAAVVVTEMKPLSTSMYIRIACFCPYTLSSCTSRSNMFAYLCYTTRLYAARNLVAAASHAFPIATRVLRNTDFRLVGSDACIGWYLWVPYTPRSFPLTSMVMFGSRVLGQC